MGLGAALDALPQARLSAIEVYQGARCLFRLDLAGVLDGPTGPRIVSQPALLEMLVAEGERHPSFRLERGVTARDLVHAGGRVAGVQVEGGGGGRELRADLVIGTDGRASLVRHRAGLDEERTPQGFDVVWAKLPLPDFLADRRTARAYLGRGHLALVFPTYDGRLQIGWIIEKGSFGDLRRQGVEAWIAEMARHVSPDLAAHLVACRSDVTQPFLLDVVCDRLTHWTRPGLLLLGDAAHPMSPVGGQGVNIALRDALVAANHLCPVLSAGTDPAAIDAATERIERERMPEVIAIQRLQQAPPRILFGRSRLATLLLGGPLPFLVRTGIAPRVLGFVFRRFARGVSSVRLTA
jgi:2-polyprenyl-6-methoxyphenol hydroxylase-like FAD-dependent oxidoreductase